MKKYEQTQRNLIITALEKLKIESIKLRWEFTDASMTNDELQILDETIEEYRKRNEEEIRSN
jgi:hypothetical protein